VINQHFDWSYTSPARRNGSTPNWSHTSSTRSAKRFFRFGDTSAQSVLKASSKRAGSTGAGDFGSSGQREMGVFLCAVM
jgi:hypothetical protein